MTSRARLSIVLCTLAALAALILAGCGSSSGGGGSGDPVAAAPKDSSVFIEGSIRPSGDLKSNIEDLAKNAAGISDPGTLIVDRIDTALKQDPESKDFTYEKDIEPWLGEKAGLYLSNYDGSDFKRAAGILQTTDSGAAQDFIDKAAANSTNKVRDASYEGVDYKVTDSDGTSVGIVDDFLVIGTNEDSFKAVVDASGGDSLDSSSAYKDAVSAVPDGSLAAVYVDIGALIKQAGASVDQQIVRFYKALGYDFSTATAVASLVPGSDQVELDVATNATPNAPAGGDVKELLGSFPASSFLAVATPDVGKQLGRAIDGIDKVGFPPQVPPGALKSTLARAGIDLDKIAASIGDVGLFAQGTSMQSLGGAVVIEATDEATATDTVKGIGTLLKRSNASGFTPVTGNAEGFAFRSPQLPKPLVVIAAGKRIGIGYGVVATQQAVSAAVSGETLDSNPTFQAAADALGSTGISGFVDPKPILQLAETLGAGSDSGFQMARPYLDKLDFLAFGTGSEGDLVTQKVILKLKD